MSTKLTRLHNSHLTAHLFSFVLLAAIPTVAFAQFVNPLSVDTIEELLVLILNAVIFILFPIIVLMIVYTGFLFVSAQGNEQQLSKARQALVWTVVGALIVLGSKALAIAICETVIGLGASITCPT